LVPKHKNKDKLKGQNVFSEAKLRKHNTHPLPLLILRAWHSDARDGDGRISSGEPNRESFVAIKRLSPSMSGKLTNLDTKWLQVREKLLETTAVRYTGHANE